MLKALPVFKQLSAAISCNLLVFSTFTIQGWATINSNDLQDLNSTFPTGPLTFAEVSSIIAISNIGSLVGNFAVLPIIHWIGPKSANHLFTIPIILSALLILWAQNVYFLYAARLLLGFANGGSAVSTPTFSIDISSANIRAASNTLFDVSINGGFIASFLLGNCLNALDQAKIYLILPIALVAVLFIYPESPEFWLRKGNSRQAKRSLKFYKGIENERDNNATITKQVDDYKNGIEVKTNDGDVTQSSKLMLTDFVSPQAKKAFYISITLAAIYILSGTIVIADYSTEVFARTESSISPKSSTLFVSIAKFTANVIFLVIVEQFSRKSLFIGSSIASAIFFCLFGTYCLLWLHQPEFNWMPLFCCACINFSSGMGLSQMPFIISMETFPKKIRSICISLTLCFFWISLFVMEFIFPILLNHIGLCGCLIIFATMCFLSAILGCFMIPNTRGKTHDEIMQMLAN